MMLFKKLIIIQIYNYYHAHIFWHLMTAITIIVLFTFETKGFFYIGFAHGVYSEI